MRWNVEGVTNKFFSSAEMLHNPADNGRLGSRRCEGHMASLWGDGKFTTTFVWLKTNCQQMRSGHMDICEEDILSFF